MLWRALAAAVIGSLAAATSAAALDPATEARNFSKTTERAAIYSSPEGQLLLRRVGLRNALASLQTQAADPERSFSANLCARGEDGCAGDPRLYEWGPKGYGLVEPVLWTARNGATISGHVCATRRGPAQRPGVVITNGSVQADEQMYWYAAQALAKAGYVVLTWDPQGQGQSDVSGEGADAHEGVPAQSDGRPFFDGTVDALDFFLSTPDRPFAPRPSSPGHRRLRVRGPARRLPRHGRRRRRRRRLELPVARYLARRRNGMTVFTNAFFCGTADSGSMWSYVVWRSTSVSMRRGRRDRRASARAPFSTRPAPSEVSIA
jgi:hypothetical protein